MITAILTTVVAWCLFYGRITPLALGLLCVGIGTPLALLGKHGHTHFLKIDVYAQVSRLNKVNATLKFWTSIVLMALCVSAHSPMVGLFLFIVMLVLIVCVGGLKLNDYVRMLALPVSFLLLSGFALLFEVNKHPIGIINIHMFEFWFCVSADAQIKTMLVIARALGAISCLYMLSLTTAMSDLIGVLRRAHCPDVLIGLMYLIYRYIFILLSMYYSMRNAANSRLGYVDYRANIHTTSNIYSSLLAGSYRRASLNFDAMESRCFDTEIRFLEKNEKVGGFHVTIAVGIIIVTLCMSLLLR